MKIIKMDPKNPDLDLIDEAIEVLAQGKLVIYPTDTIYGLGANIFDENAVNKIYNIKKRDKSKSLSICLSSIEAISFIANIPKIYEDLLIRNLPGPFTFLIQKKAIVPKYLLSNTKNHSLISKNGDIETKIGVRVPDCKIAMALAQVFPITATSANLSGQPTLDTPKKILKQLGAENKEEILSEIELAIDIGSLDSNNPSTVVDLTNNNNNTNNNYNNNGNSGSTNRSTNGCINGIKILRQGSGILI